MPRVTKCRCSVVDKGRRSLTASKIQSKLEFRHAPVVIPLRLARKICWLLNRPEKQSPAGRSGLGSPPQGQ